MVKRGINTRRRLGLDAWREVVERYESSGQSVSEFCKREGLCVSSFKRWRPRVGEDLQEQVVPPAIAAGEFVDLGTIPRSGDAARFEVRLDLGAGMTLHIVRG
jgi:transposase-like protein